LNDFEQGLGGVPWEPIIPCRSRPRSSAVVRLRRQARIDRIPAIALRPAAAGDVSHCGCTT
jgi:hypothetical protein